MDVLRNILTGVLFFVSGIMLYMAMTQPALHAGTFASFALYCIGLMIFTALTNIAEKLHILIQINEEQNQAFDRLTRRRKQ